MLFKPVKRLTKRQIKEDKLLIRVAETWDWIQGNYPKLIGGAVVLIALAVLVNYLMGRGAQEAKEAEDAYSKAQIALVEGRTGDALLQGEEVSRKYEGTGAGAQALLMVANGYFEMGRIGESRGAFQRCMDTYKGDPIMVYAGWNGLAACLEQEGNLKEAAAKYEEFSRKFEKSPFAPAALRDAARCHGQLGDHEKERATLQLIADRYKDSPVAFEARTRLKMM